MLKNCVFRADVDTRQWIHAAGRRAIKTMAQTFVAYGSQCIRVGRYPVSGNIHCRTSGTASQDLRGGDPNISRPSQG